MTVFSHRFRAYPEMTESSINQHRVKLIASRRAFRKMQARDDERIPLSKCDEDLQILIPRLADLNNVKMPDLFSHTERRLVYGEALPPLKPLPRGKLLMNIEHHERS